MVSSEDFKGIATKVSHCRFMIYIKNLKSIECSCFVFVIVFLKIIKCVSGLVFA